MPRVAVVASHPVQYQAPWFRALAKRVDLEVFFCHRQDAQGQRGAGFGDAFDWDVPLLEGYRFQWLNNVSATPGVDAFAGCDTPEISDRLREGRFDACLVQGWYLKSYVQAIQACWRQRVRLLVRGDSHLKTPRSRLKSAVKYLPYRWFLNRIDAHLYVGEANRTYLRAYHVPDSKLFFTPHFVDNGFFRRGADVARQAGERIRMREELGVAPDATVFLYVGKFIDVKRPMDVVRATARAPRGSIHTAFVGSGPLEEVMRREATRSGAPVSFMGFRNQTQLPACYAAADALVVPGSETWGLVANEAMACGLPVIASDSVGSADDLITEASTGFVYQEGDINALTVTMMALRRLLIASAPVVAQAVAERIDRYTSASAASGLLAALSSPAMSRAQAFAEVS